MAKPCPARGHQTGRSPTAETFEVQLGALGMGFGWQLRNVLWFAGSLVHATCWVLVVRSTRCWCPALRQGECRHQPVTRSLAQVHLPVTRSCVASSRREKVPAFGPLAITVGRPEAVWKLKPGS
jgi:hypothetical protein